VVVSIFDIYRSTTEYFPLRVQSEIVPSRRHIIIFFDTIIQDKSERRPGGKTQFSDCQRVKKDRF
jgi:hypothetical protein